MRALAAFMMVWTFVWPVAPAWAGIQDWQVSEVLASADSDPNVRYIELFNPVEGCMFPSTRIEVYDGQGAPLDAVAPAAVTTCFGAGTFYLLATSDAQTRFGTAADYQIVPALPAGAGQVCFTSSNTRYDCVRWGAISQPIYDFFAGSDATSALAPPGGQALSRIDTTHVIADDWRILSPTPRAPNDGSPWTPPDAGPMPDAASPDASTDGGPDGGPDAGPADAGPADAGLTDAGDRADARQRADARNTRFLDLDPVGGATCGCRVGTGQGPGRHALLVLVGLLCVAGLRRGRRPAARKSRRGSRPAHFA